MLIAKNGVPIPLLPPKTHGSTDSCLDPYVTVEDAFNMLQGNGSYPNMIGRDTNVEEGTHGVIRLHRCELAPTIRCNIPVLHYKDERAITVREAASLQSFPVTYEFHGTITR